MPRSARKAPFAPDLPASHRVSDLPQPVEFVYANGQIAVTRPTLVGGTTIRDTVFLDETEWNRMVDFVAKYWTMDGNGKVAL